MNIQIFATDLDEDAVHRARAGLYAGHISPDINTERLKSFFKKENNGYRIRARIRETIGEFTNLSSPLDSKWKIYARKAGTYSQFQPVDFPFLSPKLEPKDVEGRLFFDLADAQWDIPQFQEVLEEVLTK